MNTAEKMLADRLEQYNQTVNDVSKFKLSVREFKMFSDLMKEYASQSVATPEAEIEKKAEDYAKKEDYGSAMTDHIVCAFIAGYKAAIKKDEPDLVASDNKNSIVPCDAPVNSSNSIEQEYGQLINSFVPMMLRELIDNHDKGGRVEWLTCDNRFWLSELYYHVGKLQSAITDYDLIKMKEYAADVANLAMMCLDTNNLLPELSKQSLLNNHQQ